MKMGNILYISIQIPCVIIMSIKLSGGLNLDIQLVHLVQTGFPQAGPVSISTLSIPGSADSKNIKTKSEVHLDLEVPALEPIFHFKNYNYNKVGKVSNWQTLVVACFCLVL